jgi:two-component system chemotaxis response regulator CheB
LNQISELTVKEAENGDQILPGYAYIAPGDYHMEIENSKDGVFSIKLTQDPVVGGHRPSVNVMMNSLSKSGFPDVIGVIMTGMGADGSEGIVNLKKSKSTRIISQDEKSCVVYGMPRAAVLTSVVDLVVPLKGIAEEIVKNLGV